MPNTTLVWLLSYFSVYAYGLSRTSSGGDVKRNKFLSEENESVDPVVIVPGIFGSQLDARWNKTTAPHVYCYKSSPDWTTLWLCFQCMVPKVIDCWVDNMLLNFTDNTFRNRDGVETRVNDFGGTEGVEKLDKNGYYPYMKSLVDGILTIPGYNKGVNIRAAPYDFRYAVNSPTGKLYLQNLKTLIEDTYNVNKGRKVNILAHSMGNLYMLQFFKSVSSSWKKKYIKRYFAISGVFGGSVKSIRALVSGEIESIPRVLVDANAVRAFQRSFQSIYWLLPRQELWSKEEPLVFTPEKNYTVNQYADLLADAGFETGRDILKTLEGSTDFPDPGVDVYCIHGSDIPTAAQFRWRPKYFPDYQPDQIDGPGDGTVNKRSLELCKKFKRLKGYKVYEGIKSGEHMQILLNPDVIEYVKEIISENKLTNKLSNTTVSVF